MGPAERTCGAWLHYVVKCTRVHHDGDGRRCDGSGLVYQLKTRGLAVGAREVRLEGLDHHTVCRDMFVVERDGAGIELGNIGRKRKASGEQHSEYNHDERSITQVSVSSGSSWATSADRLVLISSGWRSVFVPSLVRISQVQHERSQGLVFWAPHCSDCGVIGIECACAQKFRMAGQVYAMVVGRCNRYARGGCDCDGPQDMDIGGRVFSGSFSEFSGGSWCVAYGGAGATGGQADWV